MGKASKLFFGDGAQTLHARVTPTAEQIEFLRVQWNNLADHLRVALTQWDYPISTWLQGSYKYNTLIKPVHRDEEYDVDVGVYFGWDPTRIDVAPTAQHLRDWVQRALLEYARSNPGVKSVEQPAKQRCSRVIYAQHFHIDTPVYHLDPKKQVRRLACLTGKWEQSDPKAIYKWFKGKATGDAGAQIRRLVRYLKGWAAIAFDDAPEARPSSIVLTVLIVEAFVGIWRPFMVADDEALTLVIRSIYKRLTESRKVPNPIDNKEDLNRIPDGAWDGFLSRLTMLREAANAAEEAVDEAAAALAWEGVFSFLMPLPKMDELEVTDTGSKRSLMPVPNIQIDVYDHEGGALLGTYQNEVPSVPKDRWLQFSIANSHVIPPYSDIGWTVRNDGAEADSIGDLGHTVRGFGLTSRGRRTRYVGKHYMDCVVRCNGAVFAVRRVSVNVVAGQGKLLAQPARNWSRLSTRRGRRP